VPTSKEFPGAHIHKSLLRSLWISVAISCPKKNCKQFSLNKIFFFFLSEVRTVERTPCCCGHGACTIVLIPCRADLLLTENMFQVLMFSFLQFSYLAQVCYDYFFYFSLCVHQNCDASSHGIQHGYITWRPWKVPKVQVHTFQVRLVHSVTSYFCLSYKISKTRARASVQTNQITGSKICTLVPFPTFSWLI
jgi:hypothetical protein